MYNHLNGQTSPYLKQHAENPVDWYPWGPEAFEKARKEDKPIFLSIGYSTCHWCHVMARESFEDNEIAELLNRFFISIKVDKEERPDIDSIYMAVCLSFTGHGGWPTSIFMTADQKPFFAGTYFPKTSRLGSIGLKELLLAVHDKWEHDREALLHSADNAAAVFAQIPPSRSNSANTALLEQAIQQYKQSFDASYGGFGHAPKFPSPHNLLFLLQQYQKHGDPETLSMAETTLRSMYSGGLFDHIGYGFCRYSTDRLFLVPHFEKMLYDNALLILTYCKAYELTQRPFYQDVAKKIASYLLSNLRSPDGGFFGAQDADSEGEEGKYYVFAPEEIRSLLGDKTGTAFCRYFGITEEGNFNGKSIPNLLQAETFSDEFDQYLPVLRAYRQRRTPLQTDEKILTSWNCLAIAALCALYRVTQKNVYLEAAKSAQKFIETQLCEGDTLYVSFCKGMHSGRGFLDDYAGYTFALLALYDVTLARAYLDRSAQISEKAISDFFDDANGGFFLYGKDNEVLLFRPKESYDGAIPSGNSLMAYNLVRLTALCPASGMESVLEKQFAYLAGEAKYQPSGYAMFLLALSDYLEPPTKITAVKADGDDLAALPLSLPSDSLVITLEEENEAYPLLHQQTTFYVCQHQCCLPPVNQSKLFSLLNKHPKT